MTHEKWIELSPDEQRIKIASLLGIVDIEKTGWDTCDFCDIGLWKGRLNGKVVYVPNYCNDLNAMQDAWRMLSPLQRAEFMIHISRLVMLKKADYSWVLEFPGIPAAQWAEAFVLTMEPEV